MEKNILVTTISNNKAKRSDTIKIRDKYHQKNVDCFIINGKWVSSHFNNLQKDYAENNAYNFASRLKPILISISNDFKQSVIGMSSKFNDSDPQFSLYQHGNALFYSYTKQQYENLNIQKCEISGLNYPNGVSPHKKVQKYIKESCDFSYAVSLNGAIKNGLPDDVIDSFGLRSKLFNNTGGLKYTFGVEIETSGGVIPKNFANGKLNIDYIYDGSVYSDDGQKYGGGEIVTGVLTGNNGIKHLNLIMSEAKNRCTVNPTCGLHVHVGNFEASDEFIVNAYMLGLILQKEMFEIFPKKRKMQIDHHGNIVGNTNPYCRVLPNINFYNVKQAGNNKEYSAVLSENYKSVFELISGGIPLSDKCNKNFDHPKGKKCGYDHSSMRYCWLNLVPTVFNTRKNKKYTLEFRQHPETLCFTKTYYWVLLCMAFVNYCENYTSNIFSGKDAKGNPITLQTIIDAAYDKKRFHAELSNYLHDRRLFFTNNAKALEKDFNIN